MTYVYNYEPNEIRQVISLSATNDYRIINAHKKIVDVGTEIMEKLCRDFYVPEIPQLVFGIHAYYPKYPEYRPVGFCRTLSPQMMFLSFEVKHCVQLLDTMLEETVPHEIAHAFADMIYWGSKPMPGHDERWVEVMKYLKIPARTYLKKTDEEIAMVNNFEELR
jgi:hypothetical protein